jgi:hypothetical protein
MSNLTPGAKALWWWRQASVVLVFLLVREIAFITKDETAIKDRPGRVVVVTPRSSVRSVLLVKIIQTPDKEQTYHPRLTGF